MDYASRFNSHAGTHGPVAKLLPKTVNLKKLVNLSRKI